MEASLRRLRDKLAGRQKKLDALPAASDERLSTSRQADGTVTTIAKIREDYGLFLLHPTFASTPVDVDIVAVHGLGGDWEKTWTDDTAGKLWLRDFVPAQFPTTACRIWSFGYDSGSLSKSVEDIDDAATSLINSLHEERQLTGSSTKPIIFIAHSLGGIVIKRALILANERSDHWNDIRDSAFGALFLGVPHRGADKAYWAALTVRLVGVASFGLAGNSNFVESLKRNSPEFSKISKAFIQPGSKLKMIRTFYETVRMGNDVIVDKDSATIGTNNELSVAIQGADHRHMCKFGSDDSQKYRPVRNALTSMVTKATGADLTTVRKHADAYRQRLLASRRRRMSYLTAGTSENQWIVNIGKTKKWQESHATSVLYVEYNEPLGWQDSVSATIINHLQLKNDTVDFRHLNVCLSDLETSEAESWEILLPRMLVAEIFAMDTQLLEVMDTSIKDLTPDEFLKTKDRQTRLDSSWENSYCSGSSHATWQQQWAILGCALHCMQKNLILALTGFETEDYKLLDNGLKFLDAGFYSRTAVKRHLLLITGQPRLEPRQQPSFNATFTHDVINTGVESGECLESLYFPELHSRRDRVEPSEKATTEWFWDHPAYDSWLSRKSSLLWIHGKPGSGKSTLAATLQRFLAKHSENILLADFFYSARGGITERSHVYMLRSILNQLLRQDSRLYPAFQSEFRQLRGGESFQWRFDDLAAILRNLPDVEDEQEVKRQTFLFILDGLDESDDGVEVKSSRTKTLQMFSELCHSKNGKQIFKVIALSRSEFSIRKLIIPDDSIDMKNENHKDIKTIVQNGMLRLSQNFREVDELLRTESRQTTSSGEDHKLEFVRQYLLQHADGVILWVVLVLRELFDISESASCTVADMNQALIEIPTNLEEFYHQIFRRIKKRSPRNVQRAEYIFAWLLSAGTTLKVREMRDVMAMFYWKDSSTSVGGQQYLDHSRVDTWNHTKWALHELCCGFVEVVPQEGLSVNTLRNERPTGPEDSVQLIHQTTREFLLSPGLCLTSPGALSGIDDICSACVDYLSLVLDEPLPHGAGKCSLESLILHLSDRPLLSYILSAFPILLKKHAFMYVGSQSTSVLHQRITEFADDAHNNRWVSVAWWLFRPWIKRVLPHSSYELEDGSPDSLKKALQFMQSPTESAQRLEQPVLPHDRSKHSIGSVHLRTAPGMTSMDSARHGQIDLSRPSSVTGPHHLRSDWSDYDRRCGLINRCLLAYGIDCALSLKCNTAVDVLVKASSDLSGEPNNLMIALAEEIREGDIHITEKGPSCCIHLLPFIAMREATGLDWTASDDYAHWMEQTQPFFILSEGTVEEKFTLPDSVWELAGNAIRSVQDWNMSRGHFLP